jgi:hypothetical protein
MKDWIRVRTENPDDRERAGLQSNPKGSARDGLEIPGFFSAGDADSIRVQPSGFSFKGCFLADGHSGVALEISQVLGQGLNQLLTPSRIARKIRPNGVLEVARTVYDLGG